MIRVRSKYGKEKKVKIMMTIINTSEIGDATFWINILLCIFHQSNYVYPKNSLHQATTSDSHKKLYKECQLK